MNKSLSQAMDVGYQKIAKPTFFQFDPENVHNSMVTVGKLLGSNPVSRQLTKQLFSFNHPNLSKKINGITFPNPVGLSAGFDYNGNLTQILDCVGFGWHTIGTITWQSYQGNPRPRLGRFPRSQALIVNKGLKNIGTQAIISKLQHLPLHIPTGISVASSNCKYNSDKEQITDMVNSFSALEDSTLKHAYYELNISCPNTFGGEPFTSPARLELLLKVTDKLHLSKPMYIKMPIDQDEAATLAMLKTINKHQVEGVILGNLTKDRTNPDIHPQDVEAWQHRKGNLSGKPTFNRSNNLIRLTKKHYKNRFTIIGTGGIFSGSDAITKMELGADLVQLITGMIFQGPQLIGQINYELAHKLEDKRLHSKTK